MKNRLRNILLLALILTAGHASTQAQVLVESVAALAGNEIVYLSDIENAVNDLRRSGN